MQLGNDIEGGSNNGLFGGFGASVSASQDGFTVAVGSSNSYENRGSDSGHVGVYSLNVDTWEQLGSDIVGEPGDSSANDVSLSRDGKTIAVGAFKNSDNGHYSGKVRIYHYNGNTWEQLGDDLEVDQRGASFGRSVSSNSNQW